jgi:hypothetical protein
MFIPMMKNRLNRHVISGTIYGIILTTSIIMGFRNTVANEFVVILTLFSSTFIIGLAKAYSEFIGLHIEKQCYPLIREVKDILKEALSIMLYSQVPTFFFVLSAFNAISLRLAYNLSGASAMISLFMFGALYGKLLDFSFKRKMTIGALNMTFGLCIILLYSFIH